MARIVQQRPSHPLIRPLCCCKTLTFCRSHAQPVEHHIYGAVNTYYTGAGSLCSPCRSPDRLLCAVYYVLSAPQVLWPAHLLPSYPLQHTPHFSGLGSTTPARELPTTESRPLRISRLRHENHAPESTTITRFEPNFGFFSIFPYSCISFARAISVIKSAYAMHLIP